MFCEILENVPVFGYTVY